MCLRMPPWRLSCATASWHRRTLPSCGRSACRLQGANELLGERARPSTRGLIGTRHRHLVTKTSRSRARALGSFWTTASCLKDAGACDALTPSPPLSAPPCHMYRTESSLVALSRFSATSHCPPRLLRHRAVRRVQLWQQQPPLGNCRALRERSENAPAPAPAKRARRAARPRAQRSAAS